MTINEEKKLKMKIKELTKKNHEGHDIILTKLAEKDEMIRKIQEQHQLEFRSFREEMENRFENFFSKINTAQLY